ncbi:MAG: hypothetical protein ACRD2S_03115 [Terriglobales bacterium]
MTYDALGRQVEQNQSGTYFQIVYTPAGSKMAVMKGQTIQQAFDLAQEEMCPLAWGIITAATIPPQMQRMQLRGWHAHKNNSLLYHGDSAV